MKRFFTKKDDINSNTKIALSALLIGFFIVNNRWFRLSFIPLMPFDISFAIVAVIVAAFVMGPVWAALVGGLGDLIAATIWPMGGAFNPAFTLSWVLTGVVFGIFLYRGRNKTDRRLVINMTISMLVVYIAIKLLLVSLWIWLFFSGGRSYWVILGVFRAWQHAVFMVVLFITCFPLLKFLRNPIERFIVIDNDNTDDESELLVQGAQEESRPD
ncbi:MAG: folate family ECF transporter S component [Firmicutes bacterium]|nr:folate family ECF transporter S component [Bacillota bacterium]